MVNPLHALLRDLFRQLAGIDAGMQLLFVSLYHATFRQNCADGVWLFYLIKLSVLALASEENVRPGTEIEMSPFSPTHSAKMAEWMAELLVRILMRETRVFRHRTS